MAVVRSEAMGAKLTEVFGLPKNTVWVELRFAAGEPVTVKCGYYPDVLKEELVEMFSEFELHPKK